MKKYTLTVIAVLTALVTLAQTKVYVYENDGLTTEFEISKFDSLSFVEPKYKPIIDICGNRYPIVEINGQVWMAMNYRCSKYDTNSEAYKNGITTISTSNDAVYTPYYIDASNTDNWSSTQYVSDMLYESVDDLGYLYNWAAAVGIADGRDQHDAFSGKRQGICPNGWHMPSQEEMSALYTYVERNAGIHGKTGIHLMSIFGWYKGLGWNTYGFYALPSGYGSGNSVDYVGYATEYWTSTAFGGLSSYILRNSYKNDYMLYNAQSNKTDASSVRCIRD